MKFRLFRRRRCRHSNRNGGRRMDLSDRTADAANESIL